MESYNPPIKKDDRVSSQETSKLLQKISEDFQTLSTIDSNNHLQFNRRTIIRALFASIDAYCFCLHCEILDAYESEKIQLCKKDKKILLSKHFSSLKEYLKACTRVFAQCRDAQLPEPISQLPPEFYLTTSIRDRITHPKSITEYDISDTEFKSIAKVVKWYLELTNWHRDLQLKLIDQVRQSTRISTEATRDMLNRVLAKPSEKGRHLD